jgi:hypothetical protein
MPESRSERIMFLAGLGAIFALAIALIPAWHSYATSHAADVSILPRSTSSSSGEETSYRTTPPSSAAKTVLTPAVLAPLQTPAASKAHPTPAPAPTQAKISLATTRGDCWLEVRQDSSSGKLVYTGTLLKGKSVTAAGKTLWIRFGAPQNVDLKLNGKATAIPSGTYDVLVTRTSVKATA